MGDYYRLGKLCPFLTGLGRICLSRNGQILPSHPYPEGSRRPWCSAKYTQHPPCVAKNIPNFYPDFTSERWTLMELRRLDNVLVWQSGFDVHALIPETSPTPLAWGTEAVDTS